MQTTTMGAHLPLAFRTAVAAVLFMVVLTLTAARARPRRHQGDLPVQQEEQNTVFHVLNSAADFQGCDVPYAYSTSSGSYQWVDPVISHHTVLSISSQDDGYEVFESPLALPFFCGNYTVVHVCGNGLVSFSKNPVAACAFNDMEFPNNTVACYFDDLDATAGGTISWGLMYDIEIGPAIVVTWLRTAFYGEQSIGVSFQVVLSAVGQVQCRYNYTAGDTTSPQKNGRTAIVGIRGNGTPPQIVFNLQPVVFAHTATVFRRTFCADVFLRAHVNESSVAYAGTAPPSWTCNFTLDGHYVVGRTSIRCVSGTNSESCSFRINVDSGPPVLVCPNVSLPTDMHMPYTSHGYDNITVVDDLDLSPVVRCDPPVGSRLYVHSNSPYQTPTTAFISCNASDSSGLTSSCDFTVLVYDAEPPRLLCLDTTVVGTDSNNVLAPSSFSNVIAVDNVDGMLNASCSLAATQLTYPSGSSSRYSVTCHASDRAELASWCTFELVATGPISTEPANGSLQHAGDVQVLFRFHAMQPRLLYLGSLAAGAIRSDAIPFFAPLRLAVNCGLSPHQAAVNATVMPILNGRVVHTAVVHVYGVPEGAQCSIHLWINGTSATAVFRTRSGVLLLSSASSFDNPGGGVTSLTVEEMPAVETPDKWMHVVLPSPSVADVGNFEARVEVSGLYSISTDAGSIGRQEALWDVRKTRASAVFEEYTVDGSLAHGRYFFCGITSAARVHCSNHYILGQMNMPDEVATGTWSAVTAGLFYACALKYADTGRAVCWGAVPGQAAVPVLSKGVWVSIKSKGSITCGLSSESEIRCWGQTPQPEPLPLPPGVVYIKIAVGDLFCCAMTSAAVGNVVCFAGTISWNFDTSRVQFPSDEAYVNLWAGRQIACAQLTNLTILCQGKDSLNMNLTNPPTLPSGVVWISLGLGWVANCGITSEHFGVVCWGQATSEILNVPATVSANVVTVEVGQNSACARLATGEMECWGSSLDSYGTLGSIPKIPVHLAVQSLALGQDHTVMTLTNGSLYCSGGNPLTAEICNTPTLTNGRTFASVFAGKYHTCSILSDSSGICWGRNNDGMTSPPKLADGDGWRSFALTHFATCGVVLNETLRCFGVSTYGLNAPPFSSDTRVQRVCAGDRFFCALLAETGRVACWGNNEWGQLDIPADIQAMNGVDVMCGSEHVCVVDSHRISVRCWGNDRQHQAPALESFLPAHIDGISGGFTHTCVSLIFPSSVRLPEIRCWGSLSAVLRRPAGMEPWVMHRTGSNSRAICASSGEVTLCQVQKDVFFPFPKLHTESWTSASPTVPLVVQSAGVETTSYWVVSGKVCALGTAGYRPCESIDEALSQRFQRHLDVWLGDGHVEVARVTLSTGHGLSTTFSVAPNVSVVPELHCGSGVPCFSVIDSGLVTFVGIRFVLYAGSSAVVATNGANVFFRDCHFTSAGTGDSQAAVQNAMFAADSSIVCRGCDLASIKVGSSSNGLIRALNSNIAMLQTSVSQVHGDTFVFQAVNSSLLMHEVSCEGLSGFEAVVSANDHSVWVALNVTVTTTMAPLAAVVMGSYAFVRDCQVSKCTADRSLLTVTGASTAALWVSSLMRNIIGAWNSGSGGISSCKAEADVYGGNGASASTADGGLISVQNSIALLFNSTLQHNEAWSGRCGGAVHCAQCNVTLLGCNVRNNSAYWGGGLCAVGHGGRVAHSTIGSNTLMSSNYACARGGGVFMMDGELHVHGATNFTFNTAELDGGGLFVDSYVAESRLWLSSATRAEDITVADNRAIHGGGGGALLSRIRDSAHILHWPVWSFFPNQAQYGAAISDGPVALTVAGMSSLTPVFLRQPFSPPFLVSLRDSLDQIVMTSETYARASQGQDYKSLVTAAVGIGSVLGHSQLRLNSTGEVMFWDLSFAGAPHPARVLLFNSSVPSFSRGMLSLGASRTVNVVGCRMGQALSAEQGTCQNCSVGFYSNQVNTATCEACPRGRFAHMSGSTGCQACLNGTASIEGSSTCTACTAGRASTGGAPCQACQVGKFANSSHMSACVTCEAGWVSTEVGLTRCQSCDSGRVAAVGSSSCYSCPRGRYALGSEGELSCKECPTGTYSSENGTKSCLPCARGYVAVLPGSVLCGPCEAGRYAPLPGATSCLACAKPAYSSAGASSCASCGVAEYAQFQDDQFLSCTACPAAALCSNGAIQLTGNEYIVVDKYTGSASVYECIKGYCTASGNCSAGRQQPASANPLWCVDCTQGGSPGLVFLGVLLALAFALGILRISQYSSGVTSVLTYFVQQVVLFVSDTETWASWLAVLNLDPASAMGSSVCVVPISQQKRLVLGLVFPGWTLLWIIIIGVVHYALTLLRVCSDPSRPEQRARRFSQSVSLAREVQSLGEAQLAFQKPVVALQGAFKLCCYIQAVVALWLFSFNTVTKTVLEFFVCERFPDGSAFVRAYPAVACDSSEWRAILPLIVFTLVLNHALLPIGLGAALYVMPPKRMLPWIGVLFQPYKPTRALWKFFQLLRQLSLVMAVVLLGGSASRSTWAVASFLNLLFLLIHIRSQPFAAAWPLNNALETLSLAVLCVVTISLSSVSVATRDSLPQTESAMLGTLVIGMFTFLLLYVILTVLEDKCRSRVAGGVLSKLRLMFRTQHPLRVGTIDPSLVRTTHEISRSRAGVYHSRSGHREQHQQHPALSIELQQHQQQQQQKPLKEQVLISDSDSDSGPDISSHAEPYSDADAAAAQVGHTGVMHSVTAAAESVPGSVASGSSNPLVVLHASSSMINVGSGLEPEDLPAGWAIYANDAGIPYYANEKLGQVVWTLDDVQHPPEEPQ